MDNFGADISDSGLVLSPDELAKKRERQGLCHTCGRICFTQKPVKFEINLLTNAVMDRLEPLTVDGRVLNGRCLICRPHTWEELNSYHSGHLSPFDADANENKKTLLATLEPTAVTLDLNTPEESDQAKAEGQSSGPPIGSKINALRAVLTATSRQAHGLLNKGSGVGVKSVDKNDGDDQELPAANTNLSHDDFFAQYDIPVSKSTRRGLSSRKFRSTRRGTNAWGDRKSIRQGSSARIGKIMRRSQTNLDYIRPISRNSSTSSSSSESDGNSSSSFTSSGSGDSKELSSYSEADSDESSIDSLSHSWRDKDTPEEKMRSILDHLFNVAITSTTNLTKIRESCSDLEDKSTRAKKTRWYASKQVNGAREQQAIAAEKEDYEVAHMLGSVIEKNLNALKKETAACCDINEHMSKLNNKKKGAIRVATHCIKEARIALRDLHVEIVDDVEENKRQLSAESNRLSSQSDRLAEELKMIEQEEEVLANEKKEHAAYRGMKEIEEQLEHDSAKLREVNERIRRLHQQLAKAEIDAATLNIRIEVSNKNVKDIQSRHLLELDQLEMKRGLTKERRIIWLSENEANNEARTSHEALVAAHPNEVESNEKIIMNLYKEISAATNLEKIVASAFDVEDTKKSQGDNGGTSEVDEIVISEALLDEKQELLFDAEDNIDDLTEEIFSIEALVPILEAKKNVAASKGDFKLASRASRKINKFLTRKKTCQILLKGEAGERKQFAKDELEKHTFLLAEKKKVVDEKGREAGMERMEQLKEESQRLNSILSTLASKSDEKATQVSLVGGFLINAQLSVMKVEGRALGEKYDGWEDVTPENDNVEKFLTSIRKGRNSYLIIPQRTVLSQLLDKKMASKTSATKAFDEDGDQDLSATIFCSTNMIVTEASSTFQLD